ncbi:MAG TPA: Asp-tRNA(Asn)/Glu-tRNA(Gln) amidotransferase GatCAB subunit B [Clostridiales bacterium UBA8153]|nr:Asp-tRNA(Asn)/Glu-tRNA(Gln) amidotransferase GatCAB subunit B [Clostridiales bacterium UBA8153]
MRYEAVIGLEIHVELATASKLFCACRVEFGAPPNANTCPVCLGLPGSLPVLNAKAVEHAVKAALALNCRVAAVSKFDRKNYFYPDLPKGYQISQYDLPVASRGLVEVVVGEVTRRVGIRRVHLEDDAGKLVHEGPAQATVAEAVSSLVDYNRAGVPLIEIVSEADLRSPEEARVFLEEVKTLLQYTAVSECKMEEGSLRVDCNISLRPCGQTTYGTPVELKNLGSFRSAQRALAYEIERQAQLLDEAGRVVRETRHWDEARGVSIALREKEEAQDYRYFPDPDLLPMVFDPGWVERMRAALPELPRQRWRRLVESYGLSPYDAGVITASQALADFYEDTVRAGAGAKAAANWVMGELLRYLNAQGTPAGEFPTTPDHLAELLALVEAGRISGTMAKSVFEEMCRTRQAPSQLVQSKGLEQLGDRTELAPVIEQVLAENPGVAADYRAGKEKALGFLVGQVMRKTQGRAHPRLVNQWLAERLRER